MAKAHCDKHQRYVPKCVDCQSAALRETVGFPKQEKLGHVVDEGTSSGVSGGGGSSEDVEEMAHDGDSDLGGGEIAEWEPEVEDDGPVPIPTVAPAPLPGYAPSRENSCNFHPEGCPEPGTEGSHTPAAPVEGPDSNAAKEPDEPKPVSDTPAPLLSPLEQAMEFFPQRLIPEGATEVCDEERPNEPYMASYEELIRRSVAGFLEVGLEPADAAIVVAAEVIEAEKLDFEEEDMPDKEGFDAGLEAAPELTGCIKDYNQGFNDGMKALHRLLIGYFSGDEDSVAFAMMRWLERKMMEMEK